MKLLESGHAFVSTAEREVVRDIEEKLCYVALDPIQEIRAKSEEITKEHRLPDNNIIQIDNSSFVHQRPFSCLQTLELKLLVCTK